jgi:hypothetical protein
MWVARGAANIRASIIATHVIARYESERFEVFDKPRRADRRPRVSQIATLRQIDSVTLFAIRRIIRPTPTHRAVDLTDAKLPKLRGGQEAKPRCGGALKACPSTALRLRKQQASIGRMLRIRLESSTALPAERDRAFASRRPVLR